MLVTGGISLQSGPHHYAHLSLLICGPSVNIYGHFSSRCIRVMRLRFHRVETGFDDDDDRNSVSVEAYPMLAVQETICAQPRRVDFRKDEEMRGVNLAYRWSVARCRYMYERTPGTTMTLSALDTEWITKQDHEGNVVPSRLSCRMSNEVMMRNEAGIRRHACAKSTHQEFPSRQNASLFISVFCIESCLYRSIPCLAQAEDQRLNWYGGEGAFTDDRFEVRFCADGPQPGAFRISISGHKQQKHSP